MKICINCECNIKPDDKFCFNCFAPIKPKSPDSFMEMDEKQLRECLPKEGINSFDELVKRGKKVVRKALKRN